MGASASGPAKPTTLTLNLSREVF